MQPVMWVAGLAVLGLACESPFTHPRAAMRLSSPADVVLGVGGEARVDGLLHLRFHEVADDSRCPTRVVCVWEGDAAVVLELELADREAPTVLDTLHTNPRFATHVAFGGYVVTLVELAPYPEEPEPIPVGRYAATLHIERTP